MNKAKVLNKDLNEKDLTFRSFENKNLSLEFSDQQ